MEFRSLERRTDPIGNSHSWLRYLGEQDFNIQLLLARTIPSHQSPFKELDSVLLLSEDGCFVVLDYSSTTHLFVTTSFLRTDGIPPALAFSVSVERSEVLMMDPKSDFIRVFNFQTKTGWMKGFPTDGACEDVSVEWLSPNPTNPKSLFGVLIRQQIGSVVSFWNRLEMESEEEFRPLLTMPIPLSSQWNKDYGLPLSLKPIPGHSSGVALICEKAICILDFRALSMENSVHSLVLKDLPLLYPSVEDSSSYEGLSSYPVLLIYEHFFKTKKSKGDQLDHLWDTFLEDKSREDSTIVKVISSSFSPRLKRMINGEEWNIMNLILVLEDGSLHNIHINYKAQISHTIWKFDFTTSKLDFMPAEDTQVHCLPEGNLLFSSEKADHVLLAPEMIKDTQLIYNLSQVFENTGPITHTLLKTNQVHETGRVLYVGCEDGKGGLVQALSSGLMTEDLCVPSSFHGLSNLWKINPQGTKSCTHLPPILILSFLQESRALALKNGSFVDITSSLGLLEDEQSVFCSAFGDGYLIQVTPSRVGLFSLRHLEETGFFHPHSSLHETYPSSSTSLLTTQEKAKEMTPRRWSFSVLSPQLSSVLRISEKYNAMTSEQETPESIWWLQRFLAGREKSLLNHKNFLELSLWSRQNRKKDKDQASIALAGICDELIALFVSAQSSLVILGVERDPPSGQTSHRRKKIKPTTQLKDLMSRKMPDLHPSCLALFADYRNLNEGAYICVIGTYHPSLEVLLVQHKLRSQRVVHLRTLMGQQLHSVSFIGVKSEDSEEVESLQEVKPIPECLAMMKGESEESSLLFVGFRNGNLGEYRIHQNWKQLELKIMRQVGALPVNLEQINSDLILAYSTRSYLLQKKTELDGSSIGKLKIQQINLPNNLAKCVVLALSQNSLFTPEEAQLDIPGILQGPQTQQLLFVFSDLLNLFHVRHVPYSMRRIRVKEPIRKLLQLPYRDQLLALTGDSDLIALDFSTGNSKVIYRDPKRDCIQAFTLWPPAGSLSTSPDQSEPSIRSSLDREEPLEGGKRARKKSGIAGSDFFRVQSYLKTVKGMAVALTCCSTFIPSLSSDCSTPRLHQASTSEESNEIFLTLGTSNTKERQNLNQKVRRGCLRLLKLKMRETGKMESWLVEELTVRSLPDPVSALSVMDEKVIFTSVSNRLVGYKLHDQIWQKIPNWANIRDPATSLSCHKNVVVTGDQFNGVVVYDYTPGEDEENPETLEHSFSSAKSAQVIDQVIINEQTFAMIDQNGLFSILQRPVEPTGCERNLYEVSRVSLGMDLISIISVVPNNNISDFFSTFAQQDQGDFFLSLPLSKDESVGCSQRKDSFILTSKKGGFYFIHPLPREAETVIQDEVESKDGDLNEIESLVFDENCLVCIAREDPHKHIRLPLDHQLQTLPEDLYFNLS